MRNRKIITAVTAMVVTIGTLLFGVTPAHAEYFTYISVLTPSGVGKKVLDIRDKSTQERGVAQIWDLYPTSELTRNQRWTARAVPDRSSVYEIVNQLTGMCLDKSQDTPNANGNAVYQVTCHQTPNQYWRLIHVVDYSNTTWEWGELQNLDGNRCLDVPGADFRAGKALAVWDCNGGRNQRWNIF
jgi:hypothetical protein